MSINDFVEMTIFQCLICFSISAKMQGFVDEYVFFPRFTQKYEMATENAGNMIFWGKSPVDSADKPVGQKFSRNCSISHRF